MVLWTITYWTLNLIIRRPWRNNSIATQFSLGIANGTWWTSFQEACRVWSVIQGTWRLCSFFSSALAFKLLSGRCKGHVWNDSTSFQIGAAFNCSVILWSWVGLHSHNLSSRISTDWSFCHREWNFDWAQVSDTFQWCMVVHIWARCWFSRLPSSLETIFPYCCIRGISLGRANSSLSHSPLIAILIWTRNSGGILGTPKRVSNGSSRSILHISDRVGVITSWTRSSVNNFWSLHRSRHWVFPVPFHELSVGPSPVVGWNNRVIIVGCILNSIVYGFDLHIVCVWSSWSHSETARTSTWATHIYNLVLVINRCKVLVIPLSAHWLSSHLKTWLVNKLFDFHHWSLIFYHFQTLSIIIFEI